MQSNMHKTTNREVTITNIRLLCITYFLYHCFEYIHWIIVLKHYYSFFSVILVLNLHDLLHSNYIQLCFSSTRGGKFLTIRGDSVSTSSIPD